MVFAAESGYSWFGHLSHGARVVKELPVKGCKPDSATHGTINTIANRLMAVSGKQQRLAVLQLTVNQFPSGKHWRFNSSLPHAVG